MKNVEYDDPSLVLNTFIQTLKKKKRYMEVCRGVCAYMHYNVYGDYVWIVGSFSSLCFLFLLKLLQSTGIIYRKTPRNVIF